MKNVKVLITILSILIVGCLFTSCFGNTQENKQTTETQTEAQTKSKTVTQAETTIATTEPATEATLASNVIKTNLYNVTVPLDWEDDYYYVISNGEKEGYTLSFYEEDLYEESRTGFLFGVSLIPDGSEIPYPSYKLLGTVLVNQKDKYSVVVYYATDVQFDEDSADDYFEMQQAEPEILESIKWNDNCKFTKDNTPAL
ncbi:MAG: hypothetical protein ACI4RM_02605 [Ruminococcus sp.]